MKPPSSMICFACGPRSRTGAWAFSEEKVSQSSNTALMSSYRLTTQQPVRSSYMTGSSARRAAYEGNGSSWAKGS